MTIITKEHIEKEYLLAVAECTDIIPIDKWATYPSGVTLTKHKSKYGMACPAGYVYINQSFLNTTATNKLRATLRHELAHLAAGLKHHHNRLFQRFNHAFGGDKEVPQAEMDEIKNNIDYKWQLFAYLKNGEKVFIGNVHRKTKRYTDYDNSRRKMNYKGLPIERFEFKENR